MLFHIIMADAAQSNQPLKHYANKIYFIQSFFILYLPNFKAYTGPKP